MTFFSPKGKRLPRTRALSLRKSKVISVLDIGSSKISCLIARLSPMAESEMLPGRTHRIDVVGHGQQRSRGIKSGVVVDIEAAERSIRLAVDAAERMAGLTIESLIVSVTAGRMKSIGNRAEIDVTDETVSASDVRYLLHSAARAPIESSRVALHSIVCDLSLDGEGGLENAVGMTGRSLAAEMHILGVEEAPLRNIEAAVNRAHLAVEAFVATPYASALATLVEDEAAMGSACIDMGGGTTTIAIFNNGHFAYADSIALGGNHITMDLARGLSISHEHAERIKVVHGCTLGGLMEEGETVALSPLGDDGLEAPIDIPRTTIARIIRPRVEETFELIRDRLRASGFGHVIGKRVVLTGGACQLTGIVETAQAVMQRRARLGRPLGVSGLGGTAKGPAFAASVGLLIYPQVAAGEQFSESLVNRLAFDESKAFGRMGQWLKQSF